MLQLHVWQVVLSVTAVQQLRKIRKRNRGLIKDGIREHLAESDPSMSSGNNLRLRRASEYAEYELRLERWRVLYRVRGGVVEVVMIGEKRGNKLFIGGEEFVL